MCNTYDLTRTTSPTYKSVIRPDPVSPPSQIWVPDLVQHRDNTKMKRFKVTERGSGSLPPTGPQSQSNYMNSLLFHLLQTLKIYYQELCLLLSVLFYLIWVFFSLQWGENLWWTAPTVFSSFSVWALWMVPFRTCCYRFYSNMEKMNEKNCQPLFIVDFSCMRKEQTWTVCRSVVIITRTVGL